MICFFSTNVMAAADTFNQWQGIYLGGNAGYWWSPNNSVTTTGTSNYLNGGTVGEQNISDALAAVGANHFSIDSRGFFGGGQVGYNRLFPNKVVMGFELDINGLTNNNNEINTTKIVNLVDFTEYYNSSISLTKKLDYLGTVRGRLGMLLKPNWLLYGTGGLAYGRVSFNTAYTANESLGYPSYEPILVQNNITKTRVGWTAGAGLEWLFHPQWSAKIEGTYYNLGTVNNNVVFSQLSPLPMMPIVWGAANVHAKTSFAAGVVHLGLNYHCN